MPGTHEASLLFGVVGGLITDWDSGTWLRLRGCKGLGNAIPFNLRVDKIETRHHARLYNTIQKQWGDAKKGGDDLTKGDGTFF